MDPGSLLNDPDLAALAAVGIGRDDALWQLGCLLSPPPPARLVRACTLGDGVEQLPADEHSDLLARADAAAARGRVRKFVPASGAASRMFAGLLAFLARAPDRESPEALAARRAEGDPTIPALDALVAALPRLAVRPALAAALAARGQELATVLRHGDLAPLAHALLDGDALGLAALPKGLLPFHLYPSGARTAFEEHLIEAAGYCRSSDGTCRLHCTAPPEQSALFTSTLAHARGELERRLGVRFAVDLSEQERATDTLALGPDRRPLRNGAGRLVLRPGGHGALLSNLAAMGGDLVVVKNIDNVLPEPAQREVVRWQRLLIGAAVRLEERLHELQRRLRAGPMDSGDRREALVFLAEELGCPAARQVAGGPRADEIALLEDRLWRPLRVCGVVRSTGEPGGGPFWVADAAGAASPQIVESSQVDHRRPDQAAIWRSSTHFNPVQLVCSLRDAEGTPYDLARFVDPQTAFVATKSKDGEELTALERPGLWNGAMAGWHTLFVEVPGHTFAPVKTLLDLARPEHQVLGSSEREVAPTGAAG